MSAFSDYSERIVSIGDFKTVDIKSSLLFSPFVLTADLVLFFRGEIVLDVEGLANLLGRLALDHVGNSLAADIQKGLDIEVVGSL